ncbi:hypothetical protein NDU88_009187 [Pleurodeles waltl]|uniref:Uncharacterized protein n=1 Tax=Pleurodeles waltl TaxID=8319 RepID=A0AAV7QQY9_PLEWA|nr:hypothetical protein NDU88_009187 [Pleurodeles waltl]
MIVWAYFCWRDGGGFVFASLSLTFGVAVLCGCLNIGGFRAVGHNSCGGIPRPRWCVGGRLHGVYPSSRVCRLGGRSGAAPLPEAGERRRGEETLKIATIRETRRASGRPRSLSALCTL